MPLEWVDKVLNEYKSLKAVFVDIRNIILIIDATKPNYEARLYKYNVNKGGFKNEWTVAHGLNSSSHDNRAIATVTGNSLTGRHTAEGWYCTQGLTNNKYKEAIRLIGLSKKVNCNALKREICIHPADYMEEEHKNKFGRYGWSWGNFAVSQATFDDLKKYKENTLMYVHI